MLVICMTSSKKKGFIFPSGRWGKIEELEEVLRTKVLGHVKGANRKKIDKLRDLAAVDSPITFDDLPFWARSLQTKKDGRTGRIGYIYPAIDR